MTKPMQIEIIDLDAGEDVRRVVTVSYRGVRVVISRDRLLELLAHEEALVSGVGAKAHQSEPPSPGGAEPVRQPERGADPRLAIETRQIPGSSISHASLSTRIKKIYEYYSDKPKVLRPAHAGLLLEVIGKFDGIVPEHATTRLESQLQTMLTWDGVNDELRTIVAAFLDDYAKRKFAAFQVAR